MKRVLIVEDEAPAHRRLRRLVLGTPGYEDAEVLVAESVREAVGHLEAGPWDVVLLDLELSGGDGFDLVGRFPSTPPTRTIVVSAHPQRAIEAFEHAVVDFVRKPVVASRLAQALGRVVEGHEPVDDGSLVVRRRGQVEVVRLEQIACCSGADDYVELCLRDGRRLLHEVTLDALEARLPGMFVRVHRSHLVNLNHVEQVRDRGSEGRVVTLRGAFTVPVSRRRYAVVDERLRATLGV